ncbi:hypothetical protein K9N68_04570 [Kovacikia minuta CCNUW1]|uniref:hypothetical protein n=1 Tax=Kovacikia minuta TaxID=2931930 RepID=UPI001CC9F0B7|nr:hypothetical protein [Kovacikia minuta]UBF27244.1 hypothetical protein K9N68_04570 [Kovacikia minuta CCNUW1]
MENIYQVDRGNPAYSFPLVETSGLEETFLQLAKQWWRETGMLLLYLCDQSSVCSPTI